MGETKTNTLTLNRLIAQTVISVILLGIGAYLAVESGDGRGYGLLGLVSGYWLR